MIHKKESPAATAATAGQEKEKTDRNYTNSIPLFEHHLNKLKSEHGLSLETILEAGLYSATPEKLNEILNRSDIECNGFVIPYNDKFSRVRLDTPLNLGKGRADKYLSPAGAVNQLYIPNTTRKMLDDPSTRLFITQGELKALKLTQEGFPCIGLPGARWFSRDNRLLADFDEINFKDREVAVVLDSDALTQEYSHENVLHAGIKLSQALKDRGAALKLGVLPDAQSKDKTGADDYIVIRGVDTFRDWIESLNPFSRPELFILDLLLDKIPSVTPKEEIPIALKPLLLEAAKMEKGLVEHYISTKVKDYFKLKVKEVDNLIKYLKELRNQAGKKGKKRDAASSSYFIDEEGCFSRYKIVQGEAVPVRLSNFVAEIESEVIEDDGAGTTAVYLMRAQIKEKALPKVEVPASTFASMNWVHKLGAEAIVEAGHGIRDTLRHGIQLRSNPSTKTVYKHLGWREIDGEFVYLTSGGAIGGQNIDVRLPQELERYALPLKPENERESISTSLSFLDIGKKSITFPLFEYVYTSPNTTIYVPQPNCSYYVTGESGSLKTTLGVSCLSHFGKFDDSKHSSFEDTANMLGRRAFTLKDSPMLVDDLYPSTNWFETQRKEAIAQRLIRSFANRTDRGRLNPDATEKGRFEPRGKLLITSEEDLSTQSTMARVCLIEIEKGDIKMDKLSKIQEKASLLPHSMSYYIYWIKSNMEYIVKEFPTKFIELRTRASKETSGNHPKLSEQIAFSQFTLNLVTSWMNDRGVISEGRASEICDEGWGIFKGLANRQNARITQEDPVTKFKEIINTLISQAKVRLDGLDEWENPTTGWSDVIGGAEAELIGYYDENFFYFIPPALWNSVLRFCRVEGTHFSTSKNVLYKMLRKRNIIVTRGNENTITETIKGKSMRVLKVHREKICQWD